MKKRDYILTLIVSFAMMITIAMSENAKGIFIPIFKSTFDINDVSIGWALLLMSFTYMIASYLGGRILEHISRKKLILIGGTSIIIGTFLLATASNLFVFYLSFIFTNTGMAFVSISINTLVSIMKVKSSAVIMNLIHFSYGMGATITHKGCGLLLDRGLTYSHIYFLLISLITIVLILVFFTKIPTEEKQEEKKERLDFTSREKLVLGIMAIGLGLYVSAEIQTGNWLVNYIKNTFQYSENTASNYSSIFFLTFSIGRFFGGFVAEKYGYLKSVLISMCVATVIFTAGLIFGSIGLYLISVSGIFFSIVFPVVVLSIKEYFPTKLNRASGIIFTMASGTNMLMGLLLGVMSKNFGIEKAMYLIPMFLVMSIALIFVVYKKGHSIISSVNMNALKQSIEQAEQGKVITKSIDELLEMEND